MQQSLQSLQVKIPKATYNNEMPGYAYDRNGGACRDSSEEGSKSPQLHQVPNHLRSNSQEPKLNTNLLNVPSQQ
jgi:hypothetical protein